MIILGSEVTEEVVGPGTSDIMMGHVPVARQRMLCPELVFRAASKSPQKEPRVSRFPHFYIHIIMLVNS